MESENKVKLSEWLKCWDADYENGYFGFVYRGEGTNRGLFSHRVEHFNMLGRHDWLFENKDLLYVFDLVTAEKCKARWECAEEIVGHCKCYVTREAFDHSKYRVTHASDSGTGMTMWVEPRERKPRQLPRQEAGKRFKFEDALPDDKRTVLLRQDGEPGDLAIFDGKSGWFVTLGGEARSFYECDTWEDLPQGIEALYY